MAATLTEKINDALDAGKTVQVSTHTKYTRVTPKLRAKWREAGFEFFRDDAVGDPEMIVGTRKGAAIYACIKYSRVQAF